MYDQQEQYNAKVATASLMGLDCSPSILDATKMEIERMEKRLAEKKELAQLLEEEPKAARILELIKRTGF